MEALGSTDMKPVLGFPDATTSVDNRLSSGRLMPWISWEEWDFVRDSLFSSSPDAVASALSRISAWRSRGFLPVVIEVTASIIEIQQKDPFFRVDQTNDTLHSEEMLAMLYCMAIMRLVNGVVEKTRKKTEVSIAEAADAIGIPRMLIDIRHEGSHRDLPSLRLVRIASIKALGWLKSYYWEPQKEEIIFLKNEDADIREKIQNELHKLAFCLKVKKGSGSNASVVEGKHCAKLLYGRNKLISWMIGKHHSSKFEGSKKQMSKTLKCLVRLYYSFSTEVVSVLLESMLKTINSSNILGLQENSQIPPCTDHMQLVLSEWKPLMTKLSKKKPEMLISLLQAALSSIEVQEARKHECEQKMMSLESVAEVQNLSLLVVWGVRILKALNHSRPKDAASQSYDFSAELPLPNAPLMELLQKCLLLSAPRNNKLMDSALLLAQMIGNSFLIQKINKYSSLTSLNPSVSEESSPMSTEFLSKQEKSLGEAASEFESIKLRRTKRKAVNTPTVDGCRSKKRWVLAKSWNSCPIGMLPHAIGSSGILPVLDLNDPRKEVTELSDSGSPVFVGLSDGEEPHGPNPSCRKRGVSCDIEVAENLGAEKLRETMEEYESDDLKGRLLIDGVWKKVGEEELQALESAVRILV